MKKPNLYKATQKSKGGQIAAGAASLIPGFGSVAGMGIGLLDSLGIFGNDNKPEPIPLEPAQINTNPYGLKHGGLINPGFTQYNTGSHNSGNDLQIDKNGEQTNNPVATVQNQENQYKGYVYSDTLVNPETGKTFNQDAARLNKRYGGSTLNFEDKASFDLSMGRLSKLNDMVRQTKEQSEMKCGGKIPMAYNGIDLNTLGKIDPTFAYQYRKGYKVQPGQPIDLNNLQVNQNTDPLNPENPNLPLNRDPFDTSRTTPDYNTEGNPTDNTQLVSDREITLGKNLSSSDNYSPSNQPYVDPVNDRGGNQKEGSGFNYNTVAIGLKGLGLAKSIADALTPAEVEKPIIPNYNNSDRYMQEANIDYTQAKQDALGVSNMTANMNRSSSSNFTQYQGREQARLANLSDILGRISETENNQRSQLNLTRGRYEEGKAVDEANRLTQNRINNQQNQAVHNLAGEKLFSEVSQIGSEFNKYQNFKEQLANNKEMSRAYVNEGLMLLGTKYQNFGLSSDFVERLKSNNFDVNDPEFIKFVGAVERTKTKT